MRIVRRAERSIKHTALATALVLVCVGNLDGQWIPQTSGTDASLRGISAVSETIAWASGSGGTYLRTLDGGATWQVEAIAGAEELDFRDVHAFDADTAYLLAAGPGAKSKIIKTSDGGRSWTTQYQNSEEGFLDALAFWDEKRGLALGDPVGGRFLILWTDDGGTNWKPIDANDSPQAQTGEGAFAASGTCLITGPGGRAWFATGGPGGARLFRSTDWGRTWYAVETPIRNDSDGSGIFSVAFEDNTHGVIVGGNYPSPGESHKNAATSFDGGRTWKNVNKPPSGYRSAVASIRHRTYVAVGPTGTDLSRDGGKTWTSISPEGFHAIGLSRTGVGWAVGAGGKVAKFRMDLIPRD